MKGRYSYLGSMTQECQSFPIEGGHHKRDNHHRSLENEVWKAGIVPNTGPHGGKRKSSLNIFKSWTTADTWLWNLTWLLIISCGRCNARTVGSCLFIQQATSLTIFWITLTCAPLSSAPPSSAACVPGTAKGFI